VINPFIGEKPSTFENRLAIPRDVSFIPGKRTSENMVLQNPFFGIG